MVESPRVPWIVAADDALRRAVNVNEAQRQVDSLEEAAVGLSELLEDFRKIAEAATVVRPLGWEGRSPSPDVRNSLREARETLDSSRLTKLIKGCERFRSDVKGDLTSYWGECVSERLGNVGELRILAASLSEVDGLAELSTTLGSVLIDLARAQDAVPSARSADLLRQAETSLRTLEESLQPDTVRRFLIAVARGGASLELLTGEVISWLSSHNAAESFKIIARSPVNPTDD